MPKWTAANIPGLSGKLDLGSLANQVCNKYDHSPQEETVSSVM